MMENSQGQGSSGKGDSVQRGLKARHVSMIALGGTIGTGLFLSSGAVVSTAGPFGAIAAYCLIGLMVYFLMTSLGEMATWLPTSGSFADYGGKYVDPAFGFALGWNYWLNWAITIAVDITTVGVVFQFWLPQVPTWIFSACALLLIFLINASRVGTFGETEYWLSIVKIVTIIVFIVIGLLTVVGIMGNHINIAHNLSVGSHGFVGGFGGFFSVLLVAGFSFEGTELLGITAGESEDPDKTIPKAMNSIFWRILLFYILSIFVISMIIYYKDPNLLGLGSLKNQVIESPFTIVFQKVGFAFAASVMNAVILTSVISSANSGLYASTRMLYSLGREGSAPQIFGHTRKNGIPMFALVGTLVIALLSFLTGIYGNSIYIFLVNASGLTGFIAWIGIALAHFRFRRAYVAQGKSLDALPYRAKLFPFGPILALILTVLVTVGQDPSLLFHGKTFVQGLIMYAAIPIFILLYFGYKIVNHTKIVPLGKVDLSRRKDET